MFIECESAVYHAPKLKMTEETFWWRLKSRNGKILATSETYDSKGNCKRAALTIGRKLGLKVKTEAIG